MFPLAQLVFLSSPPLLPLGVSLRVSRRQWDIEKLVAKAPEGQRSRPASRTGSSVSREGTSPGLLEGHLALSRCRGLVCSRSECLPS